MQPVAHMARDCEGDSIERRCSQQRGAGCPRGSSHEVDHSFFFFKQKTAYEITRGLEFRRVLFRSAERCSSRPLDGRSSHAGSAYIGCMANENRSAEDAAVFIDPIMLSNGADGEEWEDHRIDWRKQHEIWSHANGIIAGASPSRQDLAVAVMQLQRAIELRSTMLNALYNFTELPNRTAKAPYPIMADLGIIRPTMKNQLRELRNRLVHEVRSGGHTAE